MSLTSLADVKTFLRISHTKEDAILGIMLDAMEEWVQLDLALRFNVTAGDETLTEQMNGGGLNLWPKQNPIQAVTTIVDRENNGAFTLFRNNVSRIWRQDETEWLPGIERWTVTYDAGYNINTLPAGLKLGMFQLMYRAYWNRADVKSVESMDLDIEWDKIATGSIERNLSRFSFNRRFG